MLMQLLTDNRAAVLERWFSLILETYPDQVGRFLRREKDRFANPVGQTIARDIEAIYDGVLRGEGPDQLAPALDNIVRIRAVQEFAPSGALAFLFLLRRAVEETVVGGAGWTDDRRAELFTLQTQIDALASRAFDIYMQCREKLYEIRAQEARNQTWVLLERLNRMTGGGERT